MHSKDTAFFTITVDSFSFFYIKSIPKVQEKAKQRE